MLLLTSCAFPVCMKWCPRRCKRICARGKEGSGGGRGWGGRRRSQFVWVRPRGIGVLVGNFQHGGRCPPERAAQLAIRPASAHWTAGPELGADCCGTGRSVWWVFLAFLLSGSCRSRRDEYETRAQTVESSTRPPARQQESTCHTPIDLAFDFATWVKEASEPEGCAARLNFISLLLYIRLQCGCPPLASSWLRPSPRQAPSPSRQSRPLASAPRQALYPHGNLPRSAAISARPRRGRRGKLPPLCRIQTSMRTPASAHHASAGIGAPRHPGISRMEVPGIRPSASQNPRHQPARACAERLGGKTSPHSSQSPQIHPQIPSKSAAR